MDAVNIEPGSHGIRREGIVARDHADFAYVAFTERFYGIFRVGFKFVSDGDVTRVFFIDCHVYHRVVNGTNVMRDMFLMHQTVISGNYPMAVTVRDYSIPGYFIRFLKMRHVDLSAVMFDNGLRDRMKGMALGLRREF